VAGDTLADLYAALHNSALPSIFTILDSDPIWMDISDGAFSRSVIREDNKTYHQGKLLETFGDLKDSSIEMGEEETDLEICLTDPEGKKWTVSFWLRGGAMDITKVEIPSSRFDYIWGLEMGGCTWSPGNPKDLFNFLYPVDQ